MNEFIITRSQRAHRYPTDGLISRLKIDGIVLIEDLLEPSHRGSLLLALSRVIALEICLLAECAWMFRDPFTLDTFFAAIQRMGLLQRLTIEGFSLHAPYAPPLLPICLFRSPIPIDSLTIHDTHGASLHFLLDCFEPDDTILDSCWFITNLPDCDRLTLLQIQSFAGFADVLVGWDGDELVIDSCSFLDERFIGELEMVVAVTGEPLWQDVDVELRGHGDATSRNIQELQGSH
jgi:hypothetical protein